MGVPSKFCNAFSVHSVSQLRGQERRAEGQQAGAPAAGPGWRGSDMAKPKKAGGRSVKMSPLAIARIDAELVALAAELKARILDMTPAEL